MITPLKDRIIFVFEDTVTSGMFEDRTESGIYIGRSKDLSSKSPRWGVVLTVGPKVTNPEVVPGALIFIEELRWTDAVYYQGARIWMTTEKDIIMINDKKHPNAKKILKQFAVITK